MELEIIETFLANLGFRLVRKTIKRKTNVPGIYVDGMTINIDLSKLPSPGDIFHEAGHVAIVPSLFRDKAKGDVDTSLAPFIDAYFATHEFMIDQQEDPIYRALLQCSECEAQAWSYAAAVASGTPAESVFHPNAYDGAGEDLHAMLSMGRHFGVHGLQAAKMTTVKTYPTMIRWLQI